MPQAGDTEVSRGHGFPVQVGLRVAGSATIAFWSKPLRLATVTMTLSRPGAPPGFPGGCRRRRHVSPAGLRLADAALFKLAVTGTGRAIVAAVAGTTVTWTLRT